MQPHTIQVTLTGGADQCSANDVFCRQVVFQNNAANVMRLGDSTVTATKGLSLAANGGGSNAGPYVFQNVNLADFYVKGTAADKLDILAIY